MLSKFKNKITRNNKAQSDFEDTDTRILMSTQNFGKGSLLDPHLIDNFKTARLRLLHMCDFIQKHADSKQWDTVELAIDKFRSKLTDHLLVETFKLYRNTKKQLRENPEKYAFIKNYGIEMGNLCNEIVQFIEENQNIQHNPQQQTAFPSQWGNLSKQLQERWKIEEEKLYPIYLELAARGRTPESNK